MAMAKYRVVSLSKNGRIVQKDYDDLAPIENLYTQIGVEEDSYTLRLHGEPVFRGLVGPLSDGASMVRYETPQAYALLTEQWSKDRRNGRRRRRAR